MKNAEVHDFYILGTSPEKVGCYPLKIEANYYQIGELDEDYKYFEPILFLRIGEDDTDPCSYSEFYIYASILLIAIILAIVFIIRHRLLIYKRIETNHNGYSIPSNTIEVV